MISRVGDNDGIYINARNLHKSRVDAAGFHDALHLKDNFAAGGLYRLSDGKTLQSYRFLPHTGITVRVTVGGPDKCHVNRKRFIIEEFVAIQLNQFYNIFRCF